MRAVQAAGLTQRQLADMSGVPLRTLEKIEQSVILEPKLVVVAKLAKPLGKTCSDFIPSDPEPTPEPPAKPSKRK